MVSSKRSAHMRLVGLCVATLWSVVAASCAPTALQTPPSATPAPAAARVAPTSVPSVAATTPPATPAPASQGAATRQPTEAERVTKGGVLRLTDTLEAAHWDPHRTPGAAFLWEYLGNYAVNLDPKDGHPVPELAERWEFKNPQTLVLYVRKGVKFHNLPPVNGRELTAEDIVWNLERIRRPGSDYIWRGNFEPVTSIKALDRYTVQIGLKAPFAPMLSYLKGGIFPTQSILAPEVEEKLGGPDAYKDLANARGTGPFVIKSFTPSVSATAVRNPDYWQSGTPYLDGVSLILIDDPATMIAAYRVNKVDYGGMNTAAVDVTGKRDLERTRSNMKFTSVPDAGIITLYPNPQKKPFDDMRLRKAMFLAVDRQEMVKIVLAGGGHVSGPMSWKLFPGWTWSEDELLKREGYRPKSSPEGQMDIAEAKKLMRELGYGPDKPLVLEAEGARFATYANLTPMEVAKSQLREIWIDIRRINLADASSYYDAEQRGNFLFRGRVFSAAVEPDAQLYTRHHSKGGRNYQKLSDPQLDNLLEEQRKELDVIKRKALVTQANERLWNLYPQVWLMVREPYLPQQPWVEMHPTAWRRWDNPATTWIKR